MAPQTLHLQAVAGRTAASRHPQAQAVIYTGLRVCLCRTEHSRRDSASLHLTAWVQHHFHLTKSATMWSMETYKSSGRLRKHYRHAASSRSLSVGKVELENSQGLCQGVRACVCFQQAWSLPRAEPWKRGFHPGLSLIREGSLIPSHPMLWFICILCQEVMEFCSMVCTENVEDVV